MLTHPLTDLEIQKHFQNDSKFNGVYSRNSLSKIKDETYVINLDENKSRGTGCIVLYVNGNNSIVYFDSFRIEHIPKKLKNL